ncbi:RICIN domain-containing protein [Streptomyces sp. NPDC056943]|uniref:RICIN domain-containing protein n=1 Tax=Streptomyces sp. NPDC056943 TaxID=3345971 RepID=UPI003633EDE8
MFTRQRALKRGLVAVMAGILLAAVQAAVTPQSAVAAIRYNYLANQQYGDYLNGSLSGDVTTTSYTGFGAQWWDFSNKGNGNYVIYNAHESGRALTQYLETGDVRTHSIDPRWAAHSEQWWLADGPGGTWYIHNRGNDKCLTAKGRGNVVRAEPCRTGDRSQLWYQTGWTG